MRRVVNVIFVLAGLLVVMAVAANADDLYRVTLTNYADAAHLQASGSEAIIRLVDGYLVLADIKAAGILQNSNLKFELIAAGVQKDELALDIDHDRNKSPRYPVIFEEDGLRLYRVSGGIGSADATEQLAPMPSRGLPIKYTQKSTYNPRAVETVLSLDSLISLVSQDSIEAYSHRLEAFNGRVSGSDSNYAASAWIKSKFESFGYDSVVYDSFVFHHNALGYVQARNVVATKTGTTHPQWNIIVGAHMDAVPGSPGADDNGTGTVGTLEIARVLANIDTDVTFKFITFDAEEWGLFGSYHYADSAALERQPIIYMLNMDMIAHYTNDTEAMAIHGPETAFTELWAQLADSLVGITATMYQGSGGSDHYPFIQNGYQATFVHEMEFSDVYHTTHDSTVYLNYEYMKRMVQASLATVYSVNFLPPPAIISDIYDVGDGQSLQINLIPMNPALIDHITIYYGPEGSNPDQLVIIPGSQSQVIIDGLTEGQTYVFYALAYTAEGQTSVEYYSYSGTPNSVPVQVTGLKAESVKHGISLHWHPNTELDVAHYRIKRDNQLRPDIITDTMYIDGDTALGHSVHTYLVYPVDYDGFYPDPAGAMTVQSKAAWLDEGRILAINRSHTSDGYFLVDETVTGEFMRQALDGFDYDYYSDTAHQGGEKVSNLSLYDMIDYELVVIGGESARLDDIGDSPNLGGRLDTLVQYMKIGGKVIVFGRWGELNFEAMLPYDSGTSQYAYNKNFGIAARQLVLTSSSGTELQSDLIGAHTQAAGYPELMWDSMATVEHSLPNYTDVTAIPCVAYPVLDQSGIEILYTYHALNDFGVTEGQPMAWRNMTPNNQYVWFELPLSFMDRDAAVVALSRAVVDFGFATASALCIGTADIWATPNDTVHFYLGGMAGGYEPVDVDVSSLLINNALTPAANEVLAYQPDFDGPALDVKVLSSDLAGTYGELLGQGHVEGYNLAWNYTGEAETRTVSGILTVNGYICGDANTDGGVNVGDAISLISFVFKQGPEPFPLLSGDANGDAAVGVADAVYLINFVFKGGPSPVCPE